MMFLLEIKTIMFFIYSKSIQRNGYSYKLLTKLRRKPTNSDILTIKTSQTLLNSKSIKRNGDKALKAFTENSFLLLR